MRFDILKRLGMAHECVGQTDDWVAWQQRGLTTHAKMQPTANCYS